MMKSHQDNSTGTGTGTVPPVWTTAQTLGQLGLFVVLVAGGGTAIGLSTLPGAWYAELIKPPFNPPNWVFGPVWSLLYVAIAVAGWRSWRRDRGGVAMKLWAAQVGANFVWSPVFFAMQKIGMAFAIILILLALIGAFLSVAWRRDHVSAWLLLPYAAWVSFAAVLNGAIYYLNTP